MYRYLVLFILFSVFVSCSKNEVTQVPFVVPDFINGEVSEFNLTPLDLNTPDKGTFTIFANNTKYRVDFNATTQAASNAILIFSSDTILTDQSREYANLGKDVVAYNPVADNQILVLFNDGKRIDGIFTANTSFGGVFGEAVISQWRTPGDPAKPTQKAKDDISNLVKRYNDKDGPGPDNARQPIFVKISQG